MTKFIFVIVLIVIIGAAAITGLFQNNKPEQSPVSPPVSCVDFDPPNADESIVFNNEKYDLLKKDGGIISSKMTEMRKIGNVSGKDVYKLRTTNYFGQQKEDSVLYLLKEIKGLNYIFDIYIKDGLPIPDFIKNCKSIGGDMKIVEGNEKMFPPSGFNSSDIVGATTQLPAPAYIYTENKKNINDIKKLNGVVEVGKLRVVIKNKYYPLYFHLGTIFLHDTDNLDVYEYLPTDKSIDFSKQGKDSLQLKKIDFVSTPIYSWWTPECKPAIYLYPKEETSINVRVTPKGYFTLTIPEYPKSGWNVQAFPNGTIKNKGNNYSYLYYESKIINSEINKPDSGFVAKFEDLPGLYETLLPKLGLNEKEILDFKNYWLKVLPYSPYYFLGIMNEKDIEKIEPMTITPKPDTIIRVRFYFEPLDKMIDVKKPSIPPLGERIGFTVVEWGGIVKINRNNSFVCSQ